MYITENDTYYVDRLFQELGIYREGMSPEEVNGLLKDGYIKYLGSYIDKTDTKRKKLYNTEGYKISFGTLANYSAQDIVELNILHKKFISASGDIYEKDLNFKLVTEWELCHKMEGVEVKVELSDDKSSNVILAILTKGAKTLKAKIEKAIKDTGENTLFTGEKYVLLSFVYKDSIVSMIEPDAVLKLSNAIFRLQEDYPHLHIYCTNLFGQNLNSFLWVYKNYKYTWEAYNEYLSLCRKNNLELHNDVDYNTRNKNKFTRLKRLAARHILEEKANLKIGKTVLYSVAPFCQACYAKIHGAVEVLKKDTSGQLIIGYETKPIRNLSLGTFFLGRIINVSDEYVVIKIRYNKGSDSCNLSIPVPWDLLLADFKLCEVGSGESVNRYASFLDCKKLKRDVFYNFILETPVLLSEDDCLNLNHPLVNMTFSGL